MTSSFEWTDDIATGDRIINIRLSKSEMAAAELDPFDLLLFDDIDKGERSNCPMADQLLGLETLVRKMELATPTKENLSQEEES